MKIKRQITQGNTHTFELKNLPGIQIIICDKGRGVFEGEFKERGLNSQSLFCDKFPSVEDAVYFAATVLKN